MNDKVKAGVKSLDISEFPSGPNIVEVESYKYIFVFIEVFSSLEVESNSEGRELNEGTSIQQLPGKAR
jgi:hypothetical protein